MLPGSCVWKVFLRSPGGLVTLDRVSSFHFAGSIFLPGSPCVRSSGHLHSCGGVEDNPDGHSPLLQTFSLGYICSSHLEAHPREGRAQFVLPFGLAAINLSFSVRVARSSSLLGMKQWQGLNLHFVGEDADPIPTRPITLLKFLCVVRLDWSLWTVLPQSGFICWLFFPFRLNPQQIHQTFALMHWCGG